VQIPTNKIQNIMIVGCGGSGKSTLAKMLSERMGLPVIHMDHLYWESGWRKREQDEINKLVAKAIADDGWIFEGNNSQSFFLRVPSTDLIIWLDFPRYLCIWRVLKRLLQFYGRQRPDLPQGCYDRVSWEFLKWVWHYKKNSRPRIEKLFHETRNKVQQIHIKSPQEVDQQVEAIIMNKTK
jgi:adenylate kinase family enzyme